MDTETIAAYEHAAAQFADEWEGQPEPDDMYALLRRFFRPGRTVDVGCGSGRDTTWLNNNGFDAVGYDASPGLIAEASRRHPEIEFRSATLPALAEVDAGTFTNVLCETVIMHLPADVIGAAVTSLRDLLEPGGTLYLSWRVTEPTDRRDENGRLYTAFDASVVRAALSGTVTVFDEASISDSSGKRIHRVISRR